MKKILFIFLALLWAVNISFSQAYSLIDTIKQQFTGDKLQQLEQAEEIIKQGDKDKDRGERLLNAAQKDKQNANKIKRKKKRQKALDAALQEENQAYMYLIKGSKKYSQANKTIYNLYYENLSELSQNIYEPEKSQLLELLQKAESFANEGQEKRDEANKIANKKKSYEKHQEAEKLEKKAISTLMQAYVLYFRKIEEQKKQELNPEPVMDTVAEKQHTPQSTDTIIFRIQIAASKVPLPESKLKKIYPGFKFAYVDKDEGWYKYLVGEFKTYEEAYEAKKAIGVKGAFIVAYKNGKRVKNIREVCNPDDHPALHIH